MWIQVRSMDGRKTVQIDNLSKLTSIFDLRKRLEEPFEVPPERQRLFFRGKQLEDEHSLFDYDVGLNDLIQILIRPPPVVQEDNTDVLNGEETSELMEQETEKDKNCENGEQIVGNGEHIVENGIGSEIEGAWKVGSKVDARDISIGAWFEGVVVEMLEKATLDPPATEVVYRVKYDDYDEESELSEKDLRPRARTRLQWDQISEEAVVMVNYNFDQNKERGFWYDGRVTRKDDSRREKKLYCKILLGDSEDASQEVRIMFPDEVYQIEDSHTCNGEEDVGGEGKKTKPKCSHCKDKEDLKCRYCGCYVCGGKNDPGKQLLCDECDMAFHLDCLDPPLEEIPEEDEWYCPECKNDENEVIKAGEKLRFNKKKSKMMSKKSDCKRDWGKGMACVGRTKVCTIVPSNHFGPIPGVHVGTLWKFRVQVSEAGVHRPHVAGIHGRENEGAYSIVLSGGYEDDVDNGVEFSYTGSGGRDLSGNKRTAKQSSDQTLTHLNKALAINCSAPFNDKDGAEAKDWKKGKPVRVVRNFKGRKFSKYCPEEGNRYDGIYKIVKYWSETGQSGFLVWRYLLRRDDPAPPPWSAEGKKMSKKLGLTLQYPEGYLEAQAASQPQDEDKGKGRKRKGGSVASPQSSPSRKKAPKYILTKEQKGLITADKLNKKIWDTVLNPENGNKGVGLLQRVEESFMCICCQEIVFQPVTTPCGHVLCKSCLQRSFRAEVYSCPNCRFTLGKTFKIEINNELQKVLLDLFPGYDGGR